MHQIFRDPKFRLPIIPYEQVDDALVEGDVYQLVSEVPFSLRTEHGEFATTPAIKVTLVHVNYTKVFFAPIDYEVSSQEDWIRLDIRNHSYGETWALRHCS